MKKQILSKTGTVLAYHRNQKVTKGLPQQYPKKIVT